MINNIKDACFEDDITDADVLHSLRHPSSELPQHNQLEILSFEIFQALIPSGSERMYNSVKKAILKYDEKIQLQSHHIVKSRLNNSTGVRQIQTDMCQNSCLAFTGPYAHLETCPYCESKWYKTVKQKRVPVRQFYTFPLGPQLQVLWRGFLEAFRSGGWV